MSISQFNTVQEDQNLMALICAGNENAYANLYDKYVDKMLGFAFSMLKNKTDAEDLIHDVFIEIWDKANSYNSERGSVIAWLMLRVRSRCLDRFRQQKSLKKNTQIQVTEEYYDDDNEKLYEKNQQQSSIHNALESLSQKHRSVIEMSYFKGLTCVEISKNCDIPLGTVKTRLMSALNLLRTNIATSGVNL
jgi:RNA polymerase sigma-70 factor (ECF subfamily)